MQQTVHVLQTDMLQPLLSETNRTIDDETEQALEITHYDFHHFRRLLQELDEDFKSCNVGIGWLYHTHVHHGILTTFEFISGSTIMNGPLVKIELFKQNDNNTFDITNGIQIRSIHHILYGVIFILILLRKNINL